MSDLRYGPNYLKQNFPPLQSFRLFFFQQHFMAYENIR